MMTICKNSLACLLFSVTMTLMGFSSCDDNTDTFGFEVMSSDDTNVIGQDVFDVCTKSVKVDSLVATTSECYLGKVTDPELKVTTCCNFLAQFYSLENYQFPNFEQIHKENGKPVCDSVDLRLYIKSYYGDSLNSMKIGIYELDSARVMEENAIYYTNIDANKYLSTKADAVNREVTVAVADFSLSDSIRFSSSYSKNFHIKLPKSFGDKILNKYYQHPEYFKNAYSFIHYVVSGFYFKVLSGNGTLVDIDVSTLSVYFRYTANDSIYDGIQRVAATEEVIQNNYVENKNIDSLLADESCTYLKTPAGILTEAVLPIDEIFEHHQGDSINSAKVVFKRQNNNQLSRYNVSACSNILMVLKNEALEFFENQRVPDTYKSFVTGFDKSYNSYTFNNIANLVSYLKRLRDNGAGVEASDSENVRKQKIQQWEQANPEWNKVLLVPVVTETNSLGGVTSLHNEFSLTSTRLVGSSTPVKISVVYSRFKN